MRICRYNNDRLGAVIGDAVVDITDVLSTLPAPTWPAAQGDRLIQHFSEVLAFAERSVEGRPRVPLSAVKLNSPITNATKVIAAPLNYKTHVDEVNADSAIHHNVFNTSFEGYRTPIDKLGLFLKASSSLCGPGDGVTLIHRDRRNDHEVELVAVIGKTAKNVAPEDADAYIAAYCIGLDITVRGPEDRSFRKSADGYSVIGPYLVPAKEVINRDDLEFWIKVNGEVRQRSSTRNLIAGVRDLISLASRWYTLHPGDIIMTGTPDGVASIQAGDQMEAWIDQVGTMVVDVY